MLSLDGWLILLTLSAALSFAFGVHPPRAPVRVRPVRVRHRRRR